MNAVKRHKNYTLALLAIALTGLFPTLSYAQSCAPEFENQQKDRALLAHQKDVVAQQADIAQPTGSVLEWSCFDKLSMEHTDARKGIFSEGTQFLGRTMNLNFSLPTNLGSVSSFIQNLPTSMPINFNLPSGFSENAITGGVINGVSDYVSGNFSDSFLNGISGFSGGGTGGTGACNTITSGIQQIRGALATDTPFITKAADLVGFDPRQGITGGTGITSAMVDAVKNNLGELPTGTITNVLSPTSDCAAGTFYTGAIKNQDSAPGRIRTTITYRDGGCANDQKCRYEPTTEQCVAR